MTVAAEACPMMPWASMTGHSVATMLCRDDMPASVHHYRCLPGRDMGELGARVGMDGWTVAAISAPNCWIVLPRGADDQLVFGPLSSTSCLSLGRYGQ